jgi:HD-GYP domain-containing protein (c-di-GMP phosphodiesterase class II)
MEGELMFKTQGSELYKDLILFIHNNTEAIAKGNKLGLSQAFDIANYIIEDFNRSNDLMENAINFYNAKDLCESHAVNVAIFSLKMVIDMNLSKEDIQDTFVSALFHDIGLGKIIKHIQSYEGILDENLLSEDDLTLVRMHSQYGYEGILYEGNREKRIAEIILQHHEKADGSGYPHQLNEPQQWLPARIISIVDTYEALIHPRPYRDALVPPKGIETILKQKGTAFSSNMIKALINSLSLYPVGQFVKLNNGMVGKVIKTYTENPVRPDVQIYFDSSGNKLESPRILRLIEDQIIVVDQCLPGFKE